MKISEVKYNLEHKVRYKRVEYILSACILRYDKKNGTVCAFTCKPCPACGKWIVDNVSHKYCEHCGQALDLGGEEDE